MKLKSFDSVDVDSKFISIVMHEVCLAYQLTTHDRGPNEVDIHNKLRFG